jgi:hypothetical protein
MEEEQDDFSAKEGEPEESLHEEEDPKLVPRYKRKIDEIKFSNSKKRKEKVFVEEVGYEGQTFSLGDHVYVTPNTNYSAYVNSWSGRWTNK